MKIIARPYAKAIFEIAKEQKKLQEWLGILQDLSLIAEDRRVCSFLLDPRVDWQNRSQLFIDISSKFLDKAADNLIKILAKNRRLILLPLISKMYNELYAKEKNIVYADVYTIDELSTGKKQKIKAMLEKKLKSKIELNHQKDETLIGGMKIKIGDKVIDASIRGQLEKFKRFLRG